MTTYSRLLIGSENAITVSGSQIHVLNSTYVLHPFVELLFIYRKAIDETRTGEVISQGPISDGSTQGDPTSKGPIVAAAVNEGSTYLLTVGENKVLSLWRLPRLELVNERCVNTYLIAMFREK